MHRSVHHRPGGPAQSADPAAALNPAQGLGPRLDDCRRNSLKVPVNLVKQAGVSLGGGACGWRHQIAGGFHCLRGKTD